MNLPKSIIRNRVFEIGVAIVRKPKEKLVEFFHKKLDWWLNIYGVRIKQYSCYLMWKKICF